MLYFAFAKFLDNSKLTPLQPKNLLFRLKQFWLWTFCFAKNCYPKILKVAQYSNYLFDKNCYQKIYKSLIKASIF